MKILMDLRTGEPAITPDGDFVEISLGRALNQFLDVFFKTPIGGEPLLNYWGLDYQQIIQVSTSTNWESAIKYLLVSGLRNEPVVRSIDSIELERDSRTLNAKVRLTTEYGTIANPSVSINV